MNTQTTRDKIIEAADKLFRQHGYEATGVRDIAAASGVSISNLQYYFPKKVSIMAAVYQKTIESYFQDIELEDGDNYESLIQIMALEYEFILRAYNGNAFHYALNQERYLRVFLSDGDVPIDNNASERAIRGFYIGRKNWQMIDTINGAKVK